MKIKTEFEINESAEALRRMMIREKDERKRERLQFLYLFKTQKVRYLYQAAEIVGRARSTLSEWRRKYIHGGLAELLERRKSPGRTPQLKGDALEKLRERLRDPQGFGSYTEVYLWVKDELQLDIKKKTLYDVCRYKLGATCKVARPSHPQKDEAEVAAFKKTLGVK